VTGRTCGGHCRWPHAYTAEGVVQLCIGPPPSRLWRLLTKLVPWL